eukprot:COSAG01_NODE_3310_length_6282_cov_2.911693_12_plen_69_part_00
MLRHYTRGAAVLQQYAPMTLLEPWPCSRADARARSRGKQGGGRGMVERGRGGAAAGRGGGRRCRGVVG